MLKLLNWTGQLVGMFADFFIKIATIDEPVLNLATGITFTGFIFWAFNALKKRR